jgi:hypothetical protein
MQGADRIRHRLEGLAARIPNEVARALYEEALIEMKESMRRTPVDTGALRASHETLPPVISGRDISVTIQVGGPAVRYAIAVHEHLSEHSPPSWIAAGDVEFHVGGPKFLESTILESKPFMAARIAKRIELERLI